MVLAFFNSTCCVGDGKYGAAIEVILKVVITLANESRGTYTSFRYRTKERQAGISS
jgi:hypothetical protein